jgi:hypothetical protein
LPLAARSLTVLALPLNVARIRLGGRESTLMRSALVRLLPSSSGQRFQ